MATAGGKDVDKEMDDVIFGKMKSNPPPVPVDSERSQSLGPSDDAAVAAEKDSDNTRSRSNSSHVFPLKKIKNGANTATKIFGSTFQKMKEKSSAGWEQAKSSAPASSISSGWTKAVAVSSEGLGKLKDNDAYRKTTGIATAGWEKTSTVAAAGWEKTKQGATTATSSAIGTIEKAKQGATAGIEKARTSAQTGIEAVKSKTSGAHGKEG